MEGVVAYVTLWSVALTDAEVDELEAGRHPLTMHPESILSFWPLHGDGPVGTRVRDMAGGLTMGTVTSTPTKAELIPVVRNCFMQGVG